MRISGSVDKNNRHRFEGRITEPDSAQTRQQVIGQIQRDNGRMLMQFFKFSPGSTIADSFYLVERMGRDLLDMEGEYAGVWYIWPSKIGNNPDVQALLAKVAISELEAKDKTQLNLFRK